ncbi:MAG: Mur ligase family protein [Patescibacteria group bacterium]
MNLAAYQNAKKYLEALPSQVFATRKENPQLSLERTRKLLMAFGNPEKNFKFIHITGTSGKGSVTMYLHNILHTAGIKVGSYLSPHVITTTERIVVNGKLAAVPDFLWAFNKIKPYLDKTKKSDKKFVPSHFESLFAMSLLIFKKRQIEWAVIEVGCGGEFDPTNVMPSPKIAIITNIGLDHQQLLGKTKIKIAKTKAKILKQGSMLLTGETDYKIRNLLINQAKLVRIPYYYMPRPKSKVIYQDALMLWRHSSLGMIKQQMFGEHQQVNANLTIEAAKMLRIPSRAIVKGLASTKLPARIEIIQKEPTTIIDGAHNPDKIQALVATLKSLDYTKVKAIIGIGEKKNAQAILKILKTTVNHWIITQASQSYPKPMPANLLVRILKQISPNSKISLIPNCQKALDFAIDSKNKLPILITGSLYLAGELRQRWYSEKMTLIKQSNF